jgi:nucleolin
VRHGRSLFSIISIAPLKATIVVPTGQMETDRIFVGNLPFTITDEIITGIIVKNMGPGLIKQVNIMKGKKSKRPMGFLFVDFIDAKNAVKGSELFDGYDLEGRILNSNLKYADDEVLIKASTGLDEKPKTAPLTSLTSGNTIYLSNMDYSLGEEEIYNMCDDLVGVGLVSEVRIPLDKETGSPRGFAYIEFKDYESVGKAMTELSEVEVYGRVLKVERMAMPKKREVALTKEQEEDNILGSIEAKPKTKEVALTKEQQEDEILGSLQY